MSTKNQLIQSIRPRSTMCRCTTLKRLVRLIPCSALERTLKSLTSLNHLSGKYAELVLTSILVLVKNSYQRCQRTQNRSILTSVQLMALINFYSDGWRTMYRKTHSSLTFGERRSELRPTFSSMRKTELSSKKFAPSTAISINRIKTALVAMSMVRLHSIHPLMTDTLTYASVICARGLWVSQSTRS